MKYRAKHISDDLWLVVDSNDISAIAKPCSHAVAVKLAERWSTEPEERTAGPRRIPWSDAASTALMTVMQKHGFVIPAKRQAEWRAVNEKGSIPSLGISTAVLLATDGIVAYFLLGDDETLFFGHLAAFEPREARKDEDGKSKSSKKPRKSSIDAALALLADFVKNSGAQAPPK